MWTPIHNATRRELDFDIPTGLPHFLGIITQHFNIYRARPTEAFKFWLEKIEPAADEYIAKPLSEAISNKGIDLSEPGRGNAIIGSVRNYHSLAPKAQQLAKPIFQLEASDKVRGGHLTTVKECEEEFKALAKEILSRIE